MKRNLLVLFFAVSLLVSIYLAFRTQPAQAQKSSTTNPIAQQKLEYCAIVNSSGEKESSKLVGTSTIVYFDTSGYQEETVKVEGEEINKPINNQYQRAQQRALAAAIAQLGNQGWEMIGQHAFPYHGSFMTESQGATALYFKGVKR
jgi:hypothetical protein